MSTSPDRVWTMTYTINENKINIIDFSNEDNDGYMFASKLNKLQSIEEVGERIAHKVTIDDVTYDVANPKHIFSYKQPLA